MDLMEVDYQLTPVKAMSESTLSFDSFFGDTDVSEIIREDGIEGNVKFFNIPLKSGMIALMDHPASFIVYQYVSIQVLSGSVSVLGYETTPHSRPLEVFSSEKTGLIEIKTESYDRIWKKRSCHVELQQLLVSITENEKLSNDILQFFGNSCVAVFVKHIAYPVNLQFLELYFPRAFEFSLDKKKSFKAHNLYVNSSSHTPIQFNEAIEQLIAKISMYIRSSKLADEDGPRVIICGPKNIGKSSLIRYIINKILTMYIVAYYLDTDPGQTEFTPPGVVSLTKVTKPLIGPSFCHLKDPISMIFTGSASPTSPDMYSKSVAKLMHLYRRKYRDEPLFVNTMGWMEGFGLHCLGNVIKIVKPTLLVEILSDDEFSMFDYRDYLSDHNRFIQINCCFERKNPAFSPREIREMTLLSYFGKCQSPFLGPLPLNEIKPYCVSWDKIPLYIFHKKLQPFRMVEAFSHSIVALCVVSESAILKSDIPQYPLTLDDEPDNECLGFGLVRAIDEAAHLLYIITPLKMDDLKKVNAIIKGNIVIPEVLILNQDIYGEPLPYTYYRETNSLSKEKDEKDKDDSCLLNINCNPETTAEPAVSNTSSASAARFLKKIPRRYNRRSNKQ